MVEGKERETQQQERAITKTRTRRSSSLPDVREFHQPNWEKLNKVLDYDHSVEKLSKLTGVDAQKVKGIQAEQFEQALSKERANAFINNKKISQKALDLLGHDPSTEKVKKTLGVDDDDVEKAKTEIVENEEYRLEKIRSIDTPYDKKSNRKAFATLGFNPSFYRSMKLLGLDEPELQQALNEENERVETLVKHARKNLASRNKKGNRKALHVIGVDPSKEKAITTLGSEVKRDICVFVDLL